MGWRFRISAVRWTMLLSLALLALWGMLGVELVRATRRHRAMTQQIMTDLVKHAVQQYAARVDRELNYRCFYLAHAIVSQAQMANPDAPPPRADPTQPHLPRGAAQALESVDYFFRLDLARKEFFVSPGAPVLDGLEEQVIRRAAGWPHPKTPYLLVTEDTATPGAAALPHFVLALTEQPPGRPTAIGFVLKSGALRALLQQAFTSEPVLPASLGGGAEVDALATAAAYTASGALLFHRAAVPGSETAAGVGYARDESSLFAATDTLASELAGIVLEVGFHPELVHRIAGGLPPSPVLLIAILQGISVVLLAATLVLMRRQSELARIRADFVSGISHEFRTPLAQICMFAETLLLRRIRSPQEERRSTEIIHEEALRLTHMVETVLHFSRAERGLLQVTPVETRLDTLLQEVLEGFKPIAGTRGCALRADFEAGLAAEVDSEAVKQLVLNLLDNALKYGPRGQTITVTLRSSAAGVTIAVQDEGPGIPVRERRRVWKRFVRLHQDGAHVPGTGIGLAVVHEIVVRHGGRARIRDGTAPGAVFEVELPRRVPRHEAAAQEGGA